MKKQFNFRILITKAEFQGDLVIVSMNAECLLDKCFEDDFPNALNKLNELSTLEKRPHEAKLTMKYRDDPLPRGFKQAATRIHGGACSM